MAGKKISQSSSSKSIAGRGNNGDMQRNNLNNDNHQTGAAHRQEILRLLSANLISTEFARFAWFESIERDLLQIRQSLQALERAMGGGSNGGNGKNQLKRRAEDL